MLGVRPGHFATGHMPRLAPSNEATREGRKKRGREKGEPVRAAPRARQMGRGERWGKVMGRSIKDRISPGEARRGESGRPRKAQYTPGSPGEKQEIPEETQGTPGEGERESQRSRERLGRGQEAPGEERPGNDDGKEGHDNE